MGNATNIKENNGKSIVKQGDTSTVFTFALLDDNLELVAGLDGQTATVCLSTSDGVAFKKEVTVNNGAVSFVIDRLLEARRYFVDVLVGGYVFPSDHGTVVQVTAKPREIGELVGGVPEKEVIKEVIKEIEVIKEVPVTVEVIKEIEVEKEVIKEVAPDDYEPTKAENSSLKVRIADLEEKLVIAQNGLDEASSRLIEMASEQETAESERDQALADKAKLAEEVASLKAEIETLKADLDKARAEGGSGGSSETEEEMSEDYKYLVETLEKQINANPFNINSYKMAETGDTLYPMPGSLWGLIFGWMAKGGYNNGSNISELKSSVYGWLNYKFTIPSEDVTEYTFGWGAYNSKTRKMELTETRTITSTEAATMWERNSKAYKRQS